MRGCPALLVSLSGLLLLATAAEAQRRAPERASPARTPEPMTFEIASNDPEAPPEKQVRWVVAKGGIVRDTARTFDAFLAKNDIKGLTIQFDSPGGSILGGLALGEKLRQIEAKVSVGRSTPVGSEKPGAAGPRRFQLAPNAGQCNSACTYAFIGGRRRTIPAYAHFGVHMFWPSDKTEELYQQSYGVRDIENAQRTASRIAVYVQKMGVDLRMFEIASSVPHRGGIRRLSSREITDFRIAAIEYPPPTLAREGSWGLTVGRTDATLVAAAAVRDADREGLVYQLEFSCSDTPGFHRARFEVNLTQELPVGQGIAMKRVRLESGTKDAVLAFSGKDVVPIPATFNRLFTRGKGGWIAKAGVITAEVVDNAARNPAQGLKIEIDEGDTRMTSVPIVIGNLPEQHRAWASACDAIRAKRYGQKSAN